MESWYWWRVCVFSWFNFFCASWRLSRKQLGLGPYEGWSVVGEAGSLSEVKNLIETKENLLMDAIAIVDIKLGDDPGLDVLNVLSNARLGIRSLMYSMFDSSGYAMEAIDRGAMGYMTNSV